MLTAVPQLTYRTLQVLEAVLRMDSAGDSITEQSIAKAIGSPACVRLTLSRLHSCGLICWERGQKGTIHPTCRWIPAEQLDRNTWE